MPHQTSIKHKKRAKPETLDANKIQRREKKREKRMEKREWRIENREQRIENREQIIENREKTKEKGEKKIREFVRGVKDLKKNGTERQQ